MAVSKVVYGSRTLIDLTADTVTADSLSKGITAHDKSGILITGTAPSYDMIGDDLYEYYSLEDSDGGPIRDSQGRGINGQKVWKLA